MSIRIMNAVWHSQLPESVSKNKRSTVKIVLLKLADNANDNGKCWPSMARIAHETELSERSVVRAIDCLKKENIIIARTHRKDGVKHNTYFINIPLIDEMKCEFEAKSTLDNDNPFMTPTDSLSNPTDNLSKKDDQMAVKPPLTIKEPSQDNLTRGEEYLSEDELPENLHLCREGMEVMGKLDSMYPNIYLGKQKLSQWKECESALNEISYDIEESMFRVYEEKKLYRRDKLIGMPFILMINSDTDMCELIK